MWRRTYRLQMSFNKFVLQTQARPKKIESENEKGRKDQNRSTTMTKSNNNYKRDPTWQKHQQKQHHEMIRTVDIVLFGDSDIAFWPSKFYPSSFVPATIAKATTYAASTLSDSTRTGDDATSSNIHLDMSVIKKTGIPGATLSHVVDQLPNVLEMLEAHYSLEANTSSRPQGETAAKTTTTTTTSVFVVCAGENDIGCGIPSEQTILSLRRLLSMIFGNASEGQTDGQEEKEDTETPRKTMTLESRFVILLGPKFEPWMDGSSSGGSLHHKKKYSAMSRAMERCCEDFNNSKNNDNSNNTDGRNTVVPKRDCCYFVNCLTMFCGQSGNQPGAVLGGRAEAEHKYFVSDHLHLNDEGYRVWKGRVEKIIVDLVLSNKLYSIGT